MTMQITIYEGSFPDDSAEIGRLESSSAPSSGEVIAIFANGPLEQYRVSQVRHGIRRTAAGGLAHTTAELWVERVP